MGKSIYALLFTLVLSLFFSSVYAADAAAGKTKATLCSGCHGADGISLIPDVPNLAGQKEAYLVKAMKDFKDGNRNNPMMASMVENLSDTDIVDIAAYFSSLK